MRAICIAYHILFHLTTQMFEVNKL
jgi:hypothetical protein